jgi:predicted aldo/keto reductase-like oxidoreductase
MEEDLAVPGASLTYEERKNLYALVAENGKDVCHMCGQCTAGCPVGIPITDILRYLMYFDSYGKIRLARKAYSQIPDSRHPQKCQDCGICEKTCPYSVSVRRQLKRADEILA